MFCNFEPNGKVHLDFFSNFGDYFRKSQIQRGFFLYLFCFVLSFCWNMIIISLCIYAVKIILKFRHESGFLKGVTWNPLMH